MGVFGLEMIPKSRQFPIGYKRAAHRDAQIWLGVKG